MNLNNRIDAFAQLGARISELKEIPNEIFLRAEQQNNWFTRENINIAFNSIVNLLKVESLQAWTSGYKLDIDDPKRVGIVMAGNIPLVGFTDFLAIMMSGHHAKIKLSSHDNVLLPYLIDMLFEIEPELQQQITFVEQLKEIDAVIATGSDNTSRYFEYYFKKYPNIIRKNRTSCAIISGSESKEDIVNLGKDIFTYYGLGCRNVSKIYVPKGYDHTYLLDNLMSYQPIINHHKYHNNYDYNKSIYLVNIVKHLDTGFLLLTESEELVSPISVLYFEEYTDHEHLSDLLKKNEGKIQCVVSADEQYPDSVSFGNAQKPSLTDYADNVDVMEFLISLT